MSEKSPFNFFIPKIRFWDRVKLLTKKRMYCIDTVSRKGDISLMTTYKIMNNKIYIIKMEVLK